MRRRYLRYLIQGSKNNNIVYYTTIDNNTINVSMGAFNAVILSNIYDEMGIITCKGNITVINNLAFSGCKSLTSVQIPNSVTSIGESAFRGCTGLTSIEIPYSVTRIGDSAFHGCSSLTSIEIGNSVRSIGNSVFEYCSSLTSIVVDAGNSKYDSRNDCNAIIETTSNTLIAGCQNTIIPNSVRSIGDRAFAYCSSLTSIEIPYSVTSIGWGAFFDCERLTSIEIPDSVTSIGEWAFGYCSSLTNIQIPNSVTSIGEDAFFDCERLTSIQIPNSVTSIGNSVFSNCSRLSSVYVKPTIPPILGDYVFVSNASGRKIYVPRASLDAYKTASGWSAYASAIMPYDY